MTVDLDAIEARVEAAMPGDHWFADLEPEDQRCCAAFTSYEVWAAQDPDEESWDLIHTYSPWSAWETAPMCGL